MLRYALIFIGLLSSFVSSSAVARELITDFHSDITVREDRTLLVTESITVIAENRSIRHGIYRDLPTIYPHPKWAKLGIREKTSFEVQSISLDGQSVPWHQNSLPNGIRIYIGDKQRLVAPGAHQYILQYVSKNQLSDDKLSDKLWLHWNVNGQDWEFTTNALSATVHLPNNARPLAYDAWLGKTGSKEKSFSVSQKSDGSTRFDATRAIKPYEGMTISLEVPKGLVQVAETSFGRLISDNFKWLLGLVTLFLLPIYYFLAWRAVGVDPNKGVVVADYHPVRGMSAAAHNFITRNKSSNQTFAAALLSMAVKGFVSIEQNGKKTYIVNKLKPLSVDPKNKLSAGEQLVYTALFKKSDSLKLGDKYRSEVAKAKNSLNKFLKKEWRDAIYLNNTRYSWFGLAVGVIGLGLCSLHLANGQIKIGHIMPVLFFAMYATAFAAKPFGIQSLMITGFFVFSGLQVGAFSLFNSSIMVWLAIFVVGLFLLFHYLLKAPTPFGQKILDEIEGFRLYLATAEQSRLNILHPPAKTPELFENLLPFAVALGVENQWGEQFSEVFKQRAEQEGDYQPAWFSGRGYAHFNGSNIGSALSAGLASSVAAASTAPSSSSSGGFSGGAGGGGGGGGGGGW